MAEKLTAVQRHIYQYLVKSIQKQGYPPSIREICDASGLKSTSSIHRHLNHLEAKGYIRRDPLKTRAIEILSLNQEPPAETVMVPVVGKVAAGLPIFAEENIEDHLPLPKSLTAKGDLFLLKVQGESMKDGGILPGDMILVRQQGTAENGDIVVALLEDAATVKKFYREGRQIRLQPQNDAFEAIITDDLTILGKVVGLYRQY